MNKNKDEIVDELVEEFYKAPKDEQDGFINLKRDELIVLHHTLGRHIRSEYGLWEVPHTPEIDESGVDVSPNHPDAISMSIIGEVWERVT